MLRREKWWHREIERMRREHAAQTQTLIETVAHLAGKPLPVYEPPADDDNIEPARSRYTLTPEELA